MICLIKNYLLWCYKSKAASIFATEGTSVPKLCKDVFANMEYCTLSDKYIEIKQLLSLPSATKLRRLCFYKRVSVHRGGSTWPGTPPGPGTPLDQVHPPGTRYTHPWTRYTPHPAIRPLLRTVRILLECILVNLNVSIRMCSSWYIYTKHLSTTHLGYIVCCCDIPPKCMTHRVMSNNWTANMI